MESCAIYGLETQGRALCSQAGEQELIRFYVGTLSPRSEGRVRQLDFSDETNQITRKIFKLNVGEVWQIQSCSWAPNLLAICYNEIKEAPAKMKCGIWKIPDPNSSDPSEITISNSHQKHELQLGSKFDDHLGEDIPSNSNCQCVDFHPSKSRRIITIYSKKYILWYAEEGGSPKTSNKLLPLFIR